jgi:hypothetical protein
MDLFAGLPQRPAHAPVTGEGPLAHEVRASAETTYVDGLSDLHRRAWEQASGARPERVSKRLLVALSHSLERAVISGSSTSPRSTPPPCAPTRGPPTTPRTTSRPPSPSPSARSTPRCASRRASSSWSSRGRPNAATSPRSATRSASSSSSPHAATRTSPCAPGPPRSSPASGHCPCATCRRRSVTSDPTPPGRSTRVSRRPATESSSPRRGCTPRTSPPRDEHAREGGGRPDGRVAEANGAAAPAGPARPSLAPLPRRTAAAVLDALIAESSDSPAR